MGCFCDRPTKPLSENSLFFKFIAVKGLKIPQTEIFAVVKFPFEITEAEFKTDPKSLTSDSTFSFEDQSDIIAIKPIEDTKKQECCIEIYCMEKEKEILIAETIVDITEMLKKPKSWINQFYYLISVGGRLKILGGVYVKACFIKEEIEQEKITENEPEANLETYIERDTTNMVTKNDFTGITVPLRKGFVEIRVCFFENLEKNVKYSLEISLLNEKNLIDNIDTDNCDYKNAPKQLSIPITFSPLQIDIDMKLNLISENNIIDSTIIELDQIIRRDGLWIFNKKVKFLGESNAIVYLQSRFSYTGIEYDDPEIPDIELNSKVERNVEGIIFLHILKARNLRPMDDTGKSDPFVEFFFNYNPEEKEMSHVIDQNLNPVWNLKRKLPIKVTKEELENLTINFILYDRDPVGQDFLGSIEVPLKEITSESGKWINGWFKLEDPTLNKKGKKVDCGDIYIQCTFRKSGEKVGLKMPAVVE